MRAALEVLGARARIFFSRAVRALPAEDTSRFLAAEIMRAIYSRLLDRIEAEQYDVFTRLIRVPRPTQAALAARTWWRLAR